MFLKKGVLNIFAESVVKNSSNRLCRIKNELHHRYSVGKHFTVRTLVRTSERKYILLTANAEFPE